MCGNSNTYLVQFADNAATQYWIAISIKLLGVAWQGLEDGQNFKSLLDMTGALCEGFMRGFSCNFYISRIFWID